MYKKIIFAVFLSFSFNIYADITISHAIAMHGNPKYSNNFLHVDYVNPNAYKGGQVIFSTTGMYDTFNPFTLKGSAAAGIGNLFETFSECQFINNIASYF